MEKKKKEKKNPGIEARSLPPGLAEHEKHIALTHSTSLTKPRGSFSGVKFSRNPVIMIAFRRQEPLNPLRLAWRAVQLGGKKWE